FELQCRPPPGFLPDQFPSYRQCEASRRRALRDCKESRRRQIREVLWSGGFVEKPSCRSPPLPRRLLQSGAVSCVSWLDKLSFGKHTLLPLDRISTVRLCLPV